MTLTYLLEGINDINIPLWQWTSCTSWTSCIHFYFAFYRPYASTDSFHSTFFWIPTLFFTFVTTQTLTGNRFWAVKRLGSRSDSRHFDVLLWLLWQRRNNNTTACNFCRIFLNILVVFWHFYDTYRFCTCIFKWCLCCFDYKNDGQWSRRGWIFEVETSMALLKTGLLSTLF